MVDSTDHRKWLIRAEQDIRTAENNIKDDPEFLADAICYACQQAVEKVLKAYLLFNGQSSPNTHDLRYLLQLCRGIGGFGAEDVDKLASEIRDLAEYAVEARYPGDHFGTISADDARQAYFNARRIV